MSLSHEGKVGIGLTAPANTLHISGPENDGLNATLQITSGSQHLRMDGNEIDCSQTLHINLNSEKNLQLGAPGDGTVGTANSWTTFSDGRFKTDIIPLGNALEKVRNMRGVRYKWLKTGENDIGLIAQEVEKVLPEIVHSDSEGYKSVDYARLTALLLEAAKEQDAIIRQQEARITRLESTLEDFIVAEDQ